MKRKRPESSLSGAAAEPLRRMLRHAAGPAAHAMVTAAARGESVFDAWLSALSTQAYAEVARDNLAWVEEARGRRVVVEWVDDAVRVRRFDVDGREK